MMKFAFSLVAVPADQRQARASASDGAQQTRVLGLLTALALAAGADDQQVGAMQVAGCNADTRGETAIVRG